MRAMQGDTWWDNSCGRLWPGAVQWSLKSLIARGVYSTGCTKGVKLSCTPLIKPTTIKWDRHARYAKTLFVTWEICMQSPPPQFFKSQMWNSWAWMLGSLQAKTRCFPLDMAMTNFSPCYQNPQQCDLSIIFFRQDVWLLHGGVDAAHVQLNGPYSLPVEHNILT